MNGYQGSAHQMSLIVSTSSGSNSLNRKPNSLVSDPDGDTRDPASARSFERCLEKRSSLPLPDASTGSDYILSDCGHELDRPLKNTSDQANLLITTTNLLWVITPREASDSDLAFRSNATLIRNAQAMNKDPNLVTFDVGHYEDSSDVETKLADFMSTAFKPAPKGTQIERACFYKDGPYALTMRVKKGIPRSDSANSYSEMARTDCTTRLFKS